MESYIDGYKSNGYFDLKYKIYVPIDLKSYGIPSPYGIPKRAYHDNKMVDHIFETIYQSSSNKSFLGGDIDDLFQDRLGLIRSKIELILLQLDQRKNINRENLYQIGQDSCQVQNLIFQMGYRAYLMDRDRLSLEKMKFDLEAQKRMEETSYFRDTGLLNQDLKDTLIQYLGEVQKSAFINDGREKI
jgi:hypothetical protein